MLNTTRRRAVCNSLKRRSKAHFWYSYIRRLAADFTPQRASLPLPTAAAAESHWQVEGERCSWTDQTELTRPKVLACLLCLTPGVHSNARAAKSVPDQLWAGTVTGATKEYGSPQTPTIGYPELKKNSQNIYRNTLLAGHVLVRSACALGSHLLNMDPTASATSAVSTLPSYVCPLCLWADQLSHGGQC